MKPPWLALSGHKIPSPFLVLRASQQRDRGTVTGTEELLLGQRNCYWDRGIVNGTEELLMEQRNWDRGIVNGTEEL